MKILIGVMFGFVWLAILAKMLFPSHPIRSIVDFLALLTLSTLLTIIGYRCLWTWGLSRVIPAFQSRHWPYVEGTIIHSALREQITGKGGNPPSHTFYPDIKYVFAVKGERFEGHNFLYEQDGPPVFQRDEAAKNLEPLALGQTVKVFYDPNQPGRSCLKPGFYENPVAHALMYLLGAFLLTSSVTSMRAAVRRVYPKRGLIPAAKID